VEGIEGRAEETEEEVQQRRVEGRRRDTMA
jgi:hypothetical protein